MAVGHVCCQKVLAHCLLVTFLTVTTLAYSVEPRGMTSSWYSVTSKAFLELFSVVAASTTDDAQSLTVHDEEASQWDDIQTAFQAAKERIDLFISDFVEGDNPVTSGFEAGKAKFEEIRNSLPELPSLGLDLDYVKNHINEFDWETFSAQLLPSFDQGTDQEEISEMDTDVEIPVECSMTSPEMIRHAGYPVEVHTATTDDGYILHLHRIPFAQNVPPNQESFGKPSPNRPVVFLQHGILADSSCWIANGAGRSLPYLLADAGCDVWLGNVRGNTYSRSHNKMDAKKDEKFWRFSWQNMADSDLPAMVNKALEVSGHPSLYYIGHSQGTLIAFAKLSEDPEFAKKIRMMFALAPVSTLAHITSPVKSLTFLSKLAHFGLSLFGGTEILPKSSISRLISSKLHKIYNKQNHTIGEQMAYHGNNLMMLLSGVHPDHYYEDRMPVYFSHTPAGTSLHNLLHMSQLVESGKMQKWDFMSESENLKAYGQSSPPEYNLTTFQTPIVLFLGSEDQLADPEDGTILLSKLKSVVHYKLLDGWDHLDFLWGKAAAKTVYKDIQDFIIRSESDHKNYFGRKRANDEL
uniref:Lysosomal acid lipase/cholesteryl ester hydrolase n=1 Tax=Phallusia mammillata TaxID=59560 RepID=A0A6F9DJS0_9ASCI|nr:lysosomal acid lipase/cholesteryl ester hydrolase [Phallusia mammillata]